MLWRNQFVELIIFIATDEPEKIKNRQTLCLLALPFKTMTHTHTQRERERQKERERQREREVWPLRCAHM